MTVSSGSENYVFFTFRARQVLLAFCKTRMPSIVCQSRGELDSSPIRPIEQRRHGKQHLDHAPQPPSSTSSSPSRRRLPHLPNKAESGGGRRVVRKEERRKGWIMEVTAAILVRRCPESRATAKRIRPGKAADFVTVQVHFPCLGILFHTSFRGSTFHTSSCYLYAK